MCVSLFIIIIIWFLPSAIALFLLFSFELIKSRLAFIVVSAVLFTVAKPPHSLAQAAKTELGHLPE